MKLINAIISEDKEAFVQSFRESMAEKVTSILEAKKAEVASTLLVSEEVEQIDEVKQFRTSYGWAGGRNERTGGVYKMNPREPNAFQAIASHFKQHLKTNYGLKKAKHENQVGQHMHWIDTNSDGPLDHEGIIAAAKQLDPNAQTSIETRTNKLGPGYGDSEGTHHNTLLTIKGQYKNKPFELTHSNSSWEPGKYEPGQLRLSIHKNELSRAGIDQGVVRR